MFWCRVTNIGSLVQILKERTSNQCNIATSSMDWGTSSTGYDNSNVQLRHLFKNLSSVVVSGKPGGVWRRYAEDRMPLR